MTDVSNLNFVEDQPLPTKNYIEPKDISSGNLTSSVNILTNHVQSANFLSGSTGYRFDADGNLEANSGTFRGTLIANTLHIPDENTTANSFHVESDGDTFWGCTQANFTADLNNAKAYVLKNGLAKFTNLGGSTQYVDSDGTVIKIKSLISAYGPLGLHSYTNSTLPEASPTDALSPSAIGASVWTNPTNAYASDDSYATIASIGDYQQYKTFGLGSVTAPLIPHGSTILGIKVEVECQGDAADMEASVRLSPDGGTVWSTAKVNTPNNGSDTTLTFGGSTDLWTGITPEEWNTDTITDTYFVLDIQCSDLGSGTTLSVDHIKVTVYYTTYAVTGTLAYVSDGEKAGERSSGSGNLAYLDENGNWIAIDTGNIINTDIGLKVARTAADPVGSISQIYYNTTDDRFKGYDGSWEQFAFDSDLTGFAAELADPSDTLQQSSDVEVVIDNATYTQAKSLTVTVAGKIKTKFDLKQDGGPNNTIAGKIYVNDAPIGTEHTSTIATYATKEDASIDVAINDTVEVYLKTVDSNQEQAVQNFRIYYDLSTKEYIDAADDALEAAAHWEFISSNSALAITSSSAISGVPATCNFVICRVGNTSTENGNNQNQEFILHRTGKTNATAILVVGGAAGQILDLTFDTANSEIDYVETGTTLWNLYVYYYT